MQSGDHLSVRDEVGAILDEYIHGDSCKACGFNYGRAFGSLGEGFIHVHHVTPVSEIGPDYNIDPTKDLVPLCPNCHAMAHQSNLPLTVQFEGITSIF